MKYYIPLHPGHVYHLVSHAVGNELLFREQQNYSFFLRKFYYYVKPIAEPITYCLLPNHFHFMIRIHPESLIRSHYKEVKKREPKPELIPDFIMERFSNLLNSYTKSFNKYYNRKGALFMDYLRRVEVTSEKQYTTTLLYIHCNPVRHGLCKLLNDWEWNGYHDLLRNGQTELQRKEVMDWFGDSTLFKNAHRYLEEISAIPAEFRIEKEDL